MEKVEKRHKCRRGYERRKAIAGFLFVAPWIIGVCTFFLRPVIQSFIYSFNDLSFETTGIEMTFVGWEHYRYAFRVDPNFVKTLASSLGTLFINVPLIIVFSMFVAYILSKNFRGNGLAKTIFFLPVIIANGVVISIINGTAVSSTMMSGGGQSSMFQVTVLQDILSETGYSRQIVQVVTDILNNVYEIAWKSGIQILLFLSGYQSISPSIYEASKIEGATAWETFWKITFPMLSPTLLLNVIYTLVDYFSDYSSPVIKMIYNHSQNLEIPYSAAQSWAYFVLIFAVIGVFYAIINKRVFYIVE